MEQASSKGDLRALLIPGRTRSRLLVGRGESVLARFSMEGPVVEVAADLIEMAAGSFDLGAVLVDATGFQRSVVQRSEVVETCARIGVQLVPLAAPRAVSADGS